MQELKRVRMSTRARVHLRALARQFAGKDLPSAIVPKCDFPNTTQTTICEHTDIKLNGQCSEKCPLVERANMEKTNCEGCNEKIDINDMGDCDTCNFILCGRCVTKHFERGHRATLRPTDDATYRHERGF